MLVIMSVLNCYSQSGTSTTYFYCKSYIPVLVVIVYFKVYIKSSHCLLMIRNSLEYINRYLNVPFRSVYLNGSSKVGFFLHLTKSFIDVHHWFIFLHHVFFSCACTPLADEDAILYNLTNTLCLLTVMIIICC